jgi:uncharacterized protein
MNHLFEYLGLAKDIIMNNVVENLLKRAVTLYNNGDPGHDFAHITRVVRTCEILAEQEGADLTVLIPAAILHDVVNIPKHHPDRTRASQLAATEASRILAEIGYDDAAIARITSIIIEHSYSLNREPSSVESAVLQDADKLDALGAFGIMRAISCGYTFGASYYDLTDPFAKERDLDDSKFTIDHFFTKLFKLPSLMNTVAGRHEASRRVAFMQQFLQQLATEID